MLFCTTFLQVVSQPDINHVNHEVPNCPFWPKIVFLYIYGNSEHICPNERNEELTLLMTLFGLARSSIITDWLYSGQKNVPFRGTISHTGPDSNNCWLISGPAFITIFWGTRYHWTITFASSSSTSLPLLYQACWASFFRLNSEWKTLFMCGHYFLSLFHFLDKIQCFNLKSSFNWRFGQNQPRFWIPVRLLYKLVLSQPLSPFSAYCCWDGCCKWSCWW